MFTIHSKQLLDMTVVQPSSFKSRMMGHLMERFPQKAELLGTDQLGHFLDAVMQQLPALGIRHRHPASIYADLCMMLGTGFLRDPLWKPVARILNDPSFPIIKRLNRCYDESKRSMAEINGPAPFPEAVAATLSEISYDDLEDAIGTDVDSLRSFASKLWPARFELVAGGFGEQYELVAARAPSLGISNPYGINFIVLLSFLFGIDVDTDPQYEWMNGVFRDPQYNDEYYKLCSLHFFMQKYLEALLQPNPHPENAN